MNVYGGFGLSGGAMSTNWSSNVSRTGILFFYNGFGVNGKSKSSGWQWIEW